METLEELKEKYKKLDKERDIIYNKILELEDREMLKKFTVGECYLDTRWNDVVKIISIENDYIYYICASEACIKRDASYIFGIVGWEKITSHQFKDAYLAVMKDIRDPDFKEGTKSNWSITLKSIMNSVNS